MSNRSDALLRAMISIAVLSAFCVFDVCAGDCGNALIRRLSICGKFVGYDMGTGEIVSIGEHRMRRADDFSQEQRDQCFRAAELSARRQVIQTMESVSSGSRTASLEDGKRQSSAYELFAGQQLTGWSVVGTEEIAEGPDVVVAVAISWSPTSEKMMREMMSGSFQPAANWKDRVRDFIEARATFSGSTVFTDERGCPHLLGIGMAGLSGDTRLQRDRTAKWADLLAKKNLILAMNGTTCSLESFVKGRNEKITAEGGDVESSSDYGSVTDSHASGVMPKGIGPLAAFTMEHPATGQTCFVSVWDYEPTVRRGCRESRENAVRGATQCASVKIFNPATGKYEEVCK